MAETEPVQWTGWGRWALFAVSTIMVLAGAFGMEGSQIAMGWDIFLGLLLFGTLASGNRNAPLLAFLLAARFALGAMLLLAHGLLLAGGFQVLIAAVTAAAGYRLRKQAGTS